MEEGNIERDCAKVGHQATLRLPFLSAPGQLKLSIHVQGRRLKLYGKSVGCVFWTEVINLCLRKALRYDIDYPQSAGDLWVGGSVAHRYASDLAKDQTALSWPLLVRSRRCTFQGSVVLQTPSLHGSRGRHVPSRKNRAADASFLWKFPKKKCLMSWQKDRTSSFPKKYKILWGEATLPHKQAYSLPIFFFHPGGYKSSQDRIL